MVMACSHARRNTNLLILHLACLLLSLSLNNCPTHNATVQAAGASQPAFSFSFDFTNTSSYHSDDLRFEGAAMVHGNYVDLTCNSYGESIKSCAGLGRLSYGHPVRFYDLITGEVASFSTRFTFNIILTDNDKTRNNKGDGMAFFLSRYPSTMLPGSGGGNLGLLNGNGTRTALGKEAFVAVEFDTYNNTFDPDKTYDHIGIDLSSVLSANTTSLPSFSLNGSMTASVTFDNATRMLAVYLQFDEHPWFPPAEVSCRLPDPVTSLLPSDVAVGFSAGTGKYFELHQIMQWSFNSTLAPPAQQNGHEKNTKTTIALAAAIAFFLVMLWIIISYRKWRNRNQAFEEQAAQGPRRFTYQQLATATENFSDERKLGRGAFGVVYRGTLQNGVEVAVKKILNESQENYRDFFTELRTISAVSHRNLIRLVGWCRESSWNMVAFMFWCRQNQHNNLFLVYELVRNGNLDEHLHGAEVALSWETRYQIVLDIAASILYLHDLCHPYILHRDIKPANILLDENNRAKLADFGLARIANLDNALVMTSAIGTVGYLDPRCMTSGILAFDRSSDIYSLGIVLLEIACREGADLQQIWTCYRENRLQDVADTRLNLNDDFVREQMERVIKLGLWCSLSDSTNRPTIRQVMDVLSHGAPLALPSSS